MPASSHHATRGEQSSAACRPATDRSAAGGIQLGFQVVVGALFGVLGIALAVPLATAGKVLVDEFCVRDVLGASAGDNP